MLIDDVRALQALGALPDPWQRMGLERALVIRMDDVQALVGALGGEMADKDFDDLVPNVAPLAPTVWCEVARPQCTWAALLTSMDVAAPGVRAAVWDQLYGRYPWYRIGAEDTTRTDDREHAWAAELWARTRWVTLGAVPFTAPDGTLHLPQLPFHLWLDGAGRVCFRFYVWNERIAPERDRADEEMEQQERALNTALVGVCFAHCKGVTLIEHAQPRQQRRAAERAGRPPVVTYKTIDIAPVTRILHEEGQIEKTGIKRALHVCRGHFAHYSDEKPLFGKYTGTFYIPMHVRGRPEQGAVVKDYRVLAPTQAEAKKGG